MVVGRAHETQIQNVILFVVLSSKIKMFNFFKYWQANFLGGSTALIGITDQDLANDVLYMIKKNIIYISSPSLSEQIREQVKLNQLL